MTTPNTLNITNLNDIVNLFPTKSFTSATQIITTNKSIKHLSHTVIQFKNFRTPFLNEEKVKKILNNMSDSNLIVNLSLLNYLLPPGTEDHLLTVLLDDTTTINNATREIILNILDNRAIISVAATLTTKLFSLQTLASMAKIRAITQRIYCGNKLYKQGLTERIVTEVDNHLDKFMRIRYESYGKPLSSLIAQNVYNTTLAIDVAKWFIPIVLEDALAAYYITKDLDSLVPIITLLKSSYILKIISTANINISQVIHIFAYNRYKHVPTSSVIQLAKYNLLTDTELAIAVSKRTSAQATIKLYHAILTDACDGDITQLPNMSRREMLTRLTSITLDELAEKIVLKGDIEKKYQSLLNTFDLDKIE